MSANKYNNLEHYCRFESYLRFHNNLQTRLSDSYLEVLYSLCKDSKKVYDLDLTD